MQGVSGHAPAQLVTTPPVTTVPSITLRELIDKYIHLKTVIERKWGNPRTVKGYKENLARIHDIFEFVAGKKEIQISTLTREHARKVRETLAIIPANLKKKYPNTPLHKIIDDCKKGLIATTEKERLSPNTFNTYANLIGGMFRYAHQEEYVAENFFTNLRVPKKVEKTRQPFTDDELTLFFNTDLYTKKDFPLKWSWRYFVPGLMLYTGARLNEVCQLYLEDIQEVDGVLCFHIREKVDAVSGKKITSTKNVQSNRIIPVHPALKKIGLLRYVEYLRKTGKKQLFPSLSSSDSKGQHKQRHSNVSKYFNENDKKQHKISYIARCGITDPTKVLYCFRHTMETALINHPSRIEHDIIDSLMGNKMQIV